MVVSTASFAGSISPRPILSVDLTYISYNQSGNYSTWYWYLAYSQNTAQFFRDFGDCYGEITGFAASGAMYFTIPNAWWGTWAVHYIGGPGYFTKGHNDRGYLAAGVLAGTSDVKSGPYVTTAYATVSSGTPPRIPKPPVAGPAPVFVSAESNNLTFTVAEPADMGGSARVTFYCQALLPGTDTVVASWTVNTLTQTSPDVLEPDTTYDVRYYVQNGIGSGPWSPRTAMTTEAGFFVSDGVNWLGSRPLVSDGTDWVSADARVSTGSAWVRPEA